MAENHDLSAEESYARLPLAERTLLRRLSVFVGGWTVEAARAVCSRGGIPGHAIPDLLERLRNRSLIVELCEQQRWVMEDPVHQFAGERLRESGEAGLLRRLHRDWYLELAERGKPGYRVRIGRFGNEHCQPTTTT